MEDVTLEELRGLLAGGSVLLLDVRTPGEYEGERILECRSVEEVRGLVGAPQGAEIVAYCHVGSRSQFAAQVLEQAGYRARNYVGSWHEWSRAVPDPAR